MVDPKDEFYREQVFELFRNFNQGLNGITQKVAALEAALKSIDGEIERFRRVVIDGNGQESMKTTLDRTRERVAGIQESLVSHRHDFEEYQKDLTDKLEKMEHRLKTGQAPSTHSSGPTIAGFELWKVIVTVIGAIAVAAIPFVLDDDRPSNSNPEQTPPSREERQ